MCDLVDAFLIILWCGAVVFPRFRYRQGSHPRMLHQIKDERNVKIMHLNSRKKQKRIDQSLNTEKEEVESYGMP